MKTALVSALALVLFGASACHGHGSGSVAEASRSLTSALPRASGFPAPSEASAIDRAASTVAQERWSRSCPSTTDCTTSTLFVDGRRLGDAFVAQVAQGLYLHDVGGSATAREFRSLMTDQRSAFLRRVLVSAGYDALLQLDAHAALTPDQLRAVQARLVTAQKALMKGTLTVGAGTATSPPPFGAPVTSLEATLRPIMEAQELTAAFGKTSDPGKAARDFVAGALRRHRLEFTAGIGLGPADVLAYATHAVVNS